MASIEARVQGSNHRPSYTWSDTVLDRLWNKLVDRRSRTAWYKNWREQPRSSMPGASYTPRDLVPMIRFSRAWDIPRPQRPPTLFASTITSRAVILVPLIATHRPFSKSSTTFSIASGASLGQTPISASTMSIEVSMDSRSSASWDRPARLASVEYFLAGPTNASMPNVPRYETISVRPGNSVRSEASRQGANTSISGASTLV
mmetsp:Transcript_6945/g.15894  ORF Transcript_6945/g.15894 Transcript_6945/m.15894 type:complete len:203 (+) Transcript_6945:604-1212(+)